MRYRNEAVNELLANSVYNEWAMETECEVKVSEQARLNIG